MTDSRTTPATKKKRTVTKHRWNLLIEGRTSSYSTSFENLNTALHWVAKNKSIYDRRIELERVELR